MWLWNKYKIKSSTPLKSSSVDTDTDSPDQISKVWLTEFWGMLLQPPIFQQAFTRERKNAIKFGANARDRGECQLICFIYLLN